MCYCLRRCCPENGTKIDMAVQLLDALPETDARIILQMDSWYTCKALWDRALEKNITLIGAMKTNRILCPDGHRCSAQDYAAMLPNGQYHLVTVGGHEYWIHRYEGALNGIDKRVENREIIRLIRHIHPFNSGICRYNLCILPENIFQLRTALKHSRPTAAVTSALARCVSSKSTRNGKAYITLLQKCTILCGDFVFLTLDSHYQWQPYIAKYP